ncbi:TPA: hypothetical protein RY505_000659 [Escherichia albertii]|uniref:Uncharacterized protein n=1 Tax=Escherichia albertii TaxID=208962 RepID=A0A7U8TEM4_ESCAL|nr:hypothetical protein [Escherichia albertii]EFF0785332.1 hypothetical protein [Escherichia albertii]MCZ8654711.1 hypothetical protein [Escherichia albertii]TBR49515.1 hypothetical protein EYS06_18850 [Escherichia albertii]WDB32539.1 hypothetical protein PS032_15280 [Escherichia albertii]HEB1795699.1 hypothetical protein [Escherichia albertii]
MITTKQRQEIIFMATIAWFHARNLNLTKCEEKAFSHDSLLIIQSLATNPSIYGNICHQDIFEYEMEHEPFTIEEIRLVLNQPIKNLIRLTL